MQDERLLGLDMMASKGLADPSKDYHHCHFKRPFNHRAFIEGLTVEQERPLEDEPLAEKKAGGSSSNSRRAGESLATFYLAYAIEQFMQTVVLWISRVLQEVLSRMLSPPLFDRQPHLNGQLQPHPNLTPGLLTKSRTLTPHPLLNPLFLSVRLRLVCHRMAPRAVLLSLRQVQHRENPSHPHLRIVFYRRSMRQRQHRGRSLSSIHPHYHYCLLIAAL